MLWLTGEHNQLWLIMVVSNDEIWLVMKCIHSHSNTMINRQTSVSGDILYAITTGFSQVQSSEFLQRGNPPTTGDIGRGVILTFSVLQDHTPDVRKWLSLFLIAK